MPIFEASRPRVLATLAEHKLDAIVCIGGDGTMTGAAALAKRGVRIIGVPKTIDNDLMHTEITFGFQTAVAPRHRRPRQDPHHRLQHHRVMAVEIMGRNAGGWHSQHSGIASGADVILIPEIPYDLDAVCASCVARSRHGKAFTIVAVSEGAKAIGGRQCRAADRARQPRPIRLGGIAEVLVAQSRPERAWSRGRRCWATCSGAARRSRRSRAGHAVRLPRDGVADGGSVQRVGGVAEWQAHQRAAGIGRRSAAAGTGGSPADRRRPRHRTCFGETVCDK